MAYGAGGSAAAARAAAIARAIKASGSIIRVTPDNFILILSRASKPLVIYAEGGLLKRSYEYLTSYKGLTFFCKSSNPLDIGGDIELITADKIWIP